MADENNQGAESSPAPAAEPSTVPTAPDAYDHWRQTGEVKQPKAESAPARKSSDAKPVDAGDGEGRQASGRPSDSETENEVEHRPSKAERRLNELLEDLKRAGLSPSELKTFKREAQKAVEQPAKPAEEPVDPDAPKEPNEQDFDTWEEFEKAQKKYYRELTAHESRRAIENYKAEQRREAAQSTMTERLNEAKQRYGDGADKTIIEAAKQIFTGDTPVHGAIREVLNESPVLVDVLYTLGKDGLDEFLELCKSDPGKAMRKAVLVEKLVLEELGRNGGGEDRGPDGKFVSSKPQTKAPPPPRVTSGRSGPPADELERAVRDGNFDDYRTAANRRDLAARQGR